MAFLRLFNRSSVPAAIAGAPSETNVRAVQPVSKAALIVDLLGLGYPVRFRTSGRSMSPAIGDRETVVVKPAKPADLRLGDIVLYARGKRVFVHRLVEITRAGHDVKFAMRGDNLPEADAPVGPAAILGKVVQVERFWGPVSLEDPAKGTA